MEASRWSHFAALFFSSMILLLGCSCAQNEERSMSEFSVEKTDAEWREQLTPEQYDVLREAGTERPFKGVYTDLEDVGVYRCAGCDAELFASDSKYHSGCGWPAFDDVIDASKVIRREDRSLGVNRVEILCAGCGGHLGHVFPDGPVETTGLRYCINSVALQFDSATDE